MILYHASSSYYSMIARLALIESGVTFDAHRMDIHIAQQQNQPWYAAINPHMTVPGLVDDGLVLSDSRDILAHAAHCAGPRWMDSDAALAPAIASVVDGHYRISIERMTFSKAMTKIWPLRVAFPRLLARINRKLERSLPTAADRTAVEGKIALNSERIAFFTSGNLDQKLQAERDAVIAYLRTLPQPNPFLFGERISSADIVVAVLLGRLHMIGEQQLIAALPDLGRWFDMMQARETFKRADIWLTFQPLRILLKR